MRKLNKVIQENTEGKALSRKGNSKHTPGSAKRECKERQVEHRTKEKRLIPFRSDRDKYLDAEQRTDVLTVLAVNLYIMDDVCERKTRRRRTEKEENSQQVVGTSIRCVSLLSLSVSLFPFGIPHGAGQVRHVLQL